MKPKVSKPDSRKKPYSPPRLTSFGKFKDIVQGTGGTLADKGPGPQSRVK
jgi:hypothetical protein